MKFAILASIAAVSLSNAQLMGDDEEVPKPDPVEAGDDCSEEGNGPYFCQTTATSCVSWTDSGDASEYSTCQDCTEGEAREVLDSLGEPAFFMCPDDDEPEEESAKSLVLGGAALISAIAMMA